MSRILSRGSRGVEVATVQRALNRYFWPPIAVDGLYGANTEAAVRRFQEAVGFRGRDVDGMVGPKTMVALFQIFNVRIRGKLTLNPMRKLTMSPTLPGLTLKTPALPSNRVPARPLGGGLRYNDPAPITAGQNDDGPPKRFQASAQFGAQYSQRDGPGLQAELSFTARSKDYFPNSDKNSFYHGMHLETSGKLDLGIPLPPSSIYTGALGVTIQPVTDWLVLDRWHLLNPSFGIFAQVPLNSGTPPSPGSPPVDDPSSHPRAGFNLGMDLIKFDIVKDKVNVGISGTESGYWEFKPNTNGGIDHSFHWDPSIMLNVTGSFDFGPDAK